MHLVRDSKTGDEACRRPNMWRM